MKLFKQHNAKEESPETGGYYITEKGMLFWSHVAEDWFDVRENPVDIDFWYSEQPAEVEEKCVPGCKPFPGGEIKHQKGCVYHPDYFSEPSVKTKEDLKAFFRDANSYQSIDVSCFNLDEFADKWLEKRPEFSLQGEALSDENKKLRLKVKVMSSAIKQALNIRELWAFSGDTAPAEHEGEAQALVAMETDLMAAIASK